MVGVSKETSFDESILRILDDLNSSKLADARQRLIQDINKKPKPVPIGMDELTGQEITINL